MLSQLNYVLPFTLVHFVTVSFIGQKDMADICLYFPTLGNYIIQTIEQLKISQR